MATARRPPSLLSWWQVSRRAAVLQLSQRTCPRQQVPQRMVRRTPQSAFLCVKPHALLTVTARPLFSHMHMQTRCHFRKVLPMQHRTICIPSGKSPVSLVWSFWEWKDTEKSELVKQKTKCLNCFCFFWTAKKQTNKQFEDWIGHSSLLAPLLLSISLYHNFFYHN